MAHNLTDYRATVDKLILSIPKSGLATNSIPTSKDTPPPLDPKDFPNIQFWTARVFDAYHRTQTGETDGLATKQRGPGRPPKDETTEDRHPYLENADGTPVPWEVTVLIGQKARRVWQTLHDIGQAPPSWGKASETAYTYFISEMLNVPEFAFFRYCEGNWKLMRWTSKAYASWTRNYLKSNNAVATKAARVRKRKRELLADPTLLQIDSDKDEGDVIAQTPEPGPIQSASTSKDAGTSAPAPALVPTQVSSSLHYQDLY
jgi:hypothetical protein